MCPFALSQQCRNSDYSVRLRVRSHPAGCYNAIGDSMTEESRPSEIGLPLIYCSPRPTHQRWNLLPMVSSTCPSGSPLAYIWARRHTLYMLPKQADSKDMRTSLTPAISTFSNSAILLLVANCRGTLKCGCKSSARTQNAPKSWHITGMQLAIELRAS